MQAYWLIAVALVAMPLVARILLRRHRETHALAHLAQQRRLKFSSIDLIGLHDRYHNLHIIRSGHNRHAWNVLYGSTDTGLMAIFRYSYDLGFGIQQSSQQVWIGVLECGEPFANWQAAPASSAGVSVGARRVGPFECRADRSETLQRLTEPQGSAALLSLPADWRFEASGLLLAAAAPYSGDLDAPGVMYETLQRLAGELRAAGL